MDNDENNEFMQSSPPLSPNKDQMENLYKIYANKTNKRSDQQNRFLSGQKILTEPVEQINMYNSNSETKVKTQNNDQVQFKLINFYELNLTNLKQMVKVQDEKIVEQSLFVNLILNQFNKMLLIVQQERDEILEKYLQAMDQIQILTQKNTQKQNQQQQQFMLFQQKVQQEMQLQMAQFMSTKNVSSDYDNKLLELYETKQQLNNYKTQCINLEVKLKETEVKLEESNLRNTEAFTRVDLLKEEIKNLKQQNLTLDHQFQSLLKQFENYQQLQKKQSQQLQFRETSSMMNSIYSNGNQSFTEQQNIQQNNENAAKQFDQMQENDSLINAYTQFKKQNSLKQFNQIFNQSQIKYQNGKQEPPQQYNQGGGILNFPSEFRTQQQKDLEIQLTNQLNDLAVRKQQLESELNKKLNISKPALERRKREQLEQELDQVVDQINKVKLKLRENKFI